MALTSPYVLRTHYNLTPELMQKVLDYQQGRCVCGKLFTRGRPYVVDHSHLSGLVRGALDHTCNHEIGFHGERLDWFQAIATYLKDPPAVHAIGRIYVPGSAGEAGVFDDVPG